MTVLHSLAVSYNVLGGRSAFAFRAATRKKSIAGWRGPATASIVVFSMRCGTLTETARQKKGAPLFKGRSRCPPLCGIRVSEFGKQGAGWPTAGPVPESLRGGAGPGARGSCPPRPGPPPWRCAAAGRHSGGRRGHRDRHGSAQGSGVSSPCRPVFGYGVTPAPGPRRCRLSGSGRWRCHPHVRDAAPANGSESPRFASEHSQPLLRSHRTIMIRHDPRRVLIFFESFLRGATTSFQESHGGGGFNDSRSPLRPGGAHLHGVSVARS